MILKVFFYSLSFIWIRTCTTCEKSFASSLGLKHHLAKTNDCGLKAKKVKKAQEIKKRATRNHVLKYMRTKEISNQNLSVKHKRGAALSRAEKEVVLHAYESFKSMTNLVFNHECNILTCIWRLEIDLQCYQLNFQLCTIEFE